ncbi:hypothetical protein BU25DRAFT_481170 [Macroventuria anomochaeta]|uniref:Uncharacterized protein n=1 Tax=Macroventuria anomochaeta TaxID=301207 RepID=A0ACB6RJY2_9PLEO|nr:uncharacterized protein BU25DRAFT_481170 [Macroventuria anomochaeta]KAF2622084.1 hypothetical protein BU25DRAFT_481170 [Macroventuria anomochaeta]
MHTCTHAHMHTCTHAHLAQSLLRDLAKDLPLHSWLCDAIWPLKANYAEEDGYTAAMLTVAEMLKTRTTCFFEAVLTYPSGLENIMRAAEETRKSLFGKLIKAVERNLDLSLKDARDRDVEFMSIASAPKAYQQHYGSYDDRIHMWFSAGKPRGSLVFAHTAIGEAAQGHNIGLIMHCAEAPKGLSI